MTNKTNPLSPVILSPCLKCARRSKPKNTYSCEVCPARADFALAAGGDGNAMRRYVNFVYPDLGKTVVEPVIVPKPVKKRIKKTEGEDWYGRKPATEEHYEAYFPTLGMAVNKKYGQNFKTMKETITWLYDKFKNQKHIAKNEFGTSEGFVYQMLNCYNIRKINKKEVQKLWYGKKKGIV